MSANVFASDRDQREKEAKSRKVVMNDMVSDNTTSDLMVYYCKCCGELCCILDRGLESFTQRSTDRAFAVKSKPHILKSLTQLGGKIRVKREKGIESQWQWLCPACAAPIAYQCRAPEKPVKYLYFVEDSLTISLGEVTRYQIAQVCAAISSAADETLTLCPQSQIPSCICQLDDATVQIRVNAFAGADSSHLLRVGDDALHMQVCAVDSEERINSAILKYCCT